MPDLAQVVRRFGPAYLKRREGRVPIHQRKALQAILSCRTRRLGGIHYACTACGHEHVRWHSCRNRHCPRCEQGKQQDWVAARLEELPPVPYTHLVFTVPDVLAAHCRAEPQQLYRALFEAASQSVLQLARQRHGIKPGMIAVLHTWGQTLHFHPHVHLIVTAGGLNEEAEWKPTGNGYFLPVRALSSIFRAKFLAALKRFGQELPAKKLPQKWVVHARPPQREPNSILLYLARYVYRVAIDQSRIQSMDSNTVTFTYKDYKNKAKLRQMTLNGKEFLRRFLQHILPCGFVKVRHYGIFAHAFKAKALASLRSSLKAQGVQSLQATRAILVLLARTTRDKPSERCPCCGSSILIVTELMATEASIDLLKPP